MLPIEKSLLWLLSFPFIELVPPISIFEHLQLADLFSFPEELGGKDEVIQPLILAENNILIASFPLFQPLVHIYNMIAAFHNGVHVVGIDNRSDIVFFGQLSDQLIYQQGSLGIEP
jgi:hypothetical protein